MKTEKEILERLEAARVQYSHFQEDHDVAFKRYQSQRQLWGADADRGEIDYLSDLSTDIYNEIKFLEWVLGNTCPCGKDLPSDIEICPTCADRLQLEMYEDQLDWEEREAETLIAMMKEDGLNYLYDGPF